MDYINRELLEGIGVISPPRSYPHQSPRDRCVGTAEDNGKAVLTPQGGATVKVTYADGTVDFKSASGFSNKRGSRVSRPAQQPIEHRVPDVLRYVNIVGNIGNVE